MHDTAYTVMETALRRLPPMARLVLDVGSYDINGSLRPLVQSLGWEYVGLDVRSGPNVDVVSTDPYHFPLSDDLFDLVVSCCALHNVANPWRLFPEMARVLKPGGVMILHAVWRWGENRHPEDYFRIMPAGFRELFALCDGLERIDACVMNETDVLGVAWKRA